MEPILRQESIEGEKAYPVYEITASWYEDGVHDPKYTIWTLGLPVGKVWNGTSFKKMMKVEPSKQELNKYVIDWWETYLKRKDKIKNPSTPVISISLKEYEVWLITWFQHETYDIGQTDEEALESFERFVRRKEKLNYESQRATGEDVYCLMGAEDRWRWVGSKDGSAENNTKPPCRCEHCKKSGLIRIGH